MTGLNSLMILILSGGIAFAQTPQPIDPMEQEGHPRCVARQNRR